MFYSMDMGLVLSMYQLLKSGRFMFSDMDMWPENYVAIRKLQRSVLQNGELVFSNTDIAVHEIHTLEPLSLIHISEPTRRA